ncbi:MAG: hypothetical protein J7J98_04660 [candidate division Zixibacteria bacterium]|nr:hypothetical protein [candidate division Zixibacteria bacterium]
MNSSLGRVTAHLAESTDSLPPKMVALINQNIKPPTLVTADDVYVRAMYIVSDQVNSFGGRFPIEEHDRLAKLLVDSPVLIGHRKDKLPVGRNFYAELVERDGHPWVKCYFYWLRTSDTEGQLLGNIDGGIYKECSIAFTFNLPACSICGRDIRRCEHEPFETYEKDGSKEVCHFNYRQIEKVLETSLVYRGAVPETSITKEFEALTGAEQSSNDDHNYPHLVSLESVDQLDQDGSFLVVPRYDSLPLTACLRDGALSLTRLDSGCSLAVDLGEDCRPTSFRPTEPIYGVLVGYRGRERCSRQQLERFLLDRSGPVSRLTLNVYPHQGLVTLPRADPGSRLQIRIVPYRMASPESLERTAREIMTRDGVEIWPLSKHGLFPASDDIQAFEYHPVNNIPATKPRYQIEVEPDSGSANLILSGIESVAQSVSAFEIVGFDTALLHRGRSFVVRPMKRSVYKAKTKAKTKPAVMLEGEILSIKKHEDSLVLKCAGESGQELALRPIRLDGRDLFLFSISSGVTKSCRLATEVTGG